jgi:hypothetical protein
VIDVLVEELPKPYTDYDYLKKSEIGKLIEVRKFNKLISVLPNFMTV